MSLIVDSFESNSSDLHVYVSQQVEACRPFEGHKLRVLSQHDCALSWRLVVIHAAPIHPPTFLLYADGHGISRASAHKQENFDFDIETDLETNITTLDPILSSSRLLSTTVGRLRGGGWRPCIKVE